MKTLASFLNAVHVITENISFCLKGVPMSTVDLIFFFKRGWGQIGIEDFCFFLKVAQMSTEDFSFCLKRGGGVW